MVGTVGEMGKKEYPTLFVNKNLVGNELTVNIQWFIGVFFSSVSQAVLTVFQIH